MSRTPHHQADDRAVDQANGQAEPGLPEQGSGRVRRSAGAPARDAEATRARLIEAAERLFAAHGIEGVSLRSINTAAGARNAVALQYHFTDRMGLLRAIIDKHHVQIDARRHAMLDELEATAETDLRRFAAALVRPLAAKLADPAGGPEFLQIYAELFQRPEEMLDPRDTEDPARSLTRWRMMVRPLLSDDAARLHRRLTAITYTAMELARRARTAPHTDDRLFTSYVIDVVTAILAAPVSPETQRLAAERDEYQRRRRDHQAQYQEQRRHRHPPT